MATSGSYDYTANESQLIREAIELTGTLDIGDDIPPEIYDMVRRTLNIRLKYWQSIGLYLHTYQTATLFLAKTTQSYSLGPSGDHCTESYVETTLSADAASGAGTVSLTSTTGMTTGDKIGIVLDDGTLQWTTITLPNTLAANLTGDASSGNKVYTYTTKIYRPLAVSDFRRRSSDGTETPLDDPVSLNEYFRLPNKTTSGKVVKLAYDPQTINSRLYVWPTADNVTDQIVFRYQKPIADMDDIENTFDVPIDWLAPMSVMLADAIAPKLRVGLDHQQFLAMRAKEIMDNMDDFEQASIFIEPRME